MKVTRVLLVLTFGICFCLMSAGQVSAQAKPAPAKLAATLTIKLGAMESKLAAGGDVTIYVLGNDDVAAELTKTVGQAIGKSTLKQVESGAELPGEKPSCLFVGDPALFSIATKYTREQKILSITAHPELVSKGVSLGIGLGDDGKPKILLNLSASAAEELDWNPAIMKIAQTIK